MKRLVLYDFHSLACCLDRCSCGGQPGVLPIKGDYIKGGSIPKDCVLVIECPDCGARSDEGALWEIMVSWNKERRKENGRV